MREYTAIGSMLYGTGGESFKRGILGGVSRTLKAGNSNTMVVFAREGLPKSAQECTRGIVISNPRRFFNEIRLTGAPYAPTLNATDYKDPPLAIEAREVSPPPHIHTNACSQSM